MVRLNYSALLKILLWWALNYYTQLKNNFMVSTQLQYSTQLKNNFMVSTQLLYAVNNTFTVSTQLLYTLLKILL